MRYIVTTRELVLYERVYIIDAESKEKALESVQTNSSKPIIDSIERRKIFDPSVESLSEHPSYLVCRNAYAHTF